MSLLDTRSSTRFSVGLEQGPDESFRVHSFSVPGCSAIGGNQEEALEAFGRELNSWLGFLEAHGEPVPDRDEALEIAVDEWVETDVDVAGGESAACFDADREPVSHEELVRAVQRIGSLRARLMPRIRRARDEELERVGNPPWTARRILDELARAQWWTLTRLGASPLAQVPDRTVARLDTAMALIIQTLTELPPESRGATLQLEGEEWTPRKVLRHLLWLEWSLGSAAIDALNATGAENASEEQ